MAGTTQMKNTVVCPSGDQHGICKNSQYLVIPEVMVSRSRCPKGYYTVGGEKFTNKTRFAQKTVRIKGIYCEGGRKIRCPAGRYGATMQLSNISCSGKWMPVTIAHLVQ